MLMLIAKSEAEAKLKEYFNTSHVNVNLVWVCTTGRVIVHFNTSHVNVNLLSLTLAITIYINFNTSHVNVNQ